jgi:uncharacterized protein YjbI with pentapeptide repeats
MLHPVRAPVRPRFVSPATRASLPLEEEVQVWLEDGAPGCLQILGGPGSGKTTALAHLAEIYQGLPRVTLFDEGEWLKAPSPGFVIFVGEASAHAAAQNAAQKLTLAPWSRDELIEYLLAAHPRECAAVLSRVTRADELALGGVPELWRIALDEMAGDASLPGPIDALLHFIDRRVASREICEQLESSCLEAELIPRADASEPPKKKFFGFPIRGNPERTGARSPNAGLPGGLPEDVGRLLRHALVRRHLGARGLVDRLNTRDWNCDFLAARLPRDLVVAAGARLQNCPEAIAALKSPLVSDEAEAMATSLLHAADPGWVLAPKANPHILDKAYLDGVHWPEIKLQKANLRETDLTLAELQGANLNYADAFGVVLIQARLSGASLSGFQGPAADLYGADLSGVHGSRVDFYLANLSQAKLDNARLRDANFREADLRHTSLRGAVLRRAHFERALLEETDFSGAHLEGALLTGSSMIGGNLTGALLRNSGLGDVEWPGVCLRHADLRHATFHMGSSRSGLVDSTIASEGSRTGFYTDEYNEQDFKSPEEIRKANLRGADLRGAIIDGVDFYLVDLRGAQYYADQAAHFRRCGAILEDRRCS